MTTPTTPISPVPALAPDTAADGATLAAAPPASRLPLPATRRVPLSAHGVGLVFLLLTIAGFVALGVVLPDYTLSQTARRGLTYDTLFAELHDALLDAPDRPLRRAIRAVQVDAIVPVPNGLTAVTYDTLAVADAASYPSLLPGGFLHDEIANYNAYQQERLDAIRRGRMAGAATLDLRATPSPSIFRTELREVNDGSDDPAIRDTVALAERGVPYGLRVPSPFDAAGLVAVTTRTYSRNLAWISPTGSRPVISGGRIPGEPPCPFRSVRDSVYIECTAPGSPFTQLVLRFPDRFGETGTANLRSGERALYDGTPLPRGRTVDVSTGGMFQFRSSLSPRPGIVRPEPVILEWALGGTLGGTQWINGRIRWQSTASHTSPFVQQIAGAAGFGASVELERGRNIPLSIDEGLTEDLQIELEDFLSCALRPSGCPRNAANRTSARSPRSAIRSISRDIAFATVVLASVKTGEVLGVAEFGPSNPIRGEQSWILRPVNVGSAVKPLLAVAALMRRPELGTLEIRNEGRIMEDIWGIRLGKSFEAGINCPVGWIDLRLFLSCSSNRYSAALVAAALQPDAKRGLIEWDDAPGVTFRLDGTTHTGRRPHLPLDSHRRVGADTLNGSALAAGLFALDSLNTSIELAQQLGRDGRDSAVWQGLRDDRLNPVRVPLGLWPEQSRLGLTRGGRPATLRQLAQFAVGAAENRVTTLDLTEAFGRIITDRRLSLTFVPARRQASFPPLGLSKGSWYLALVAGLHDVGTVGTAHGTQEQVTRQLGDGVLFFGKSGTLNAPPHVRNIRVADTALVNGVRTVSIATIADTVVPPVVAKTLVFAVGPADAEDVNPARAARGGRSRVRGGRGNNVKANRIDASAATSMSTGALQCGVIGTMYFRLRRNPPAVQSLATEFANERLWQLLRRHWDRLQVC